MNLYFLSEPIKKLLDGLEKFREQLQKDELARVAAREQKALFAKYPQFEKHHIETVQRGYNADYDQLCRNMLDDRTAKWRVSHYHMHYNGAHGKHSLWIGNFPYASHTLVNHRAGRDAAFGTYPNTTKFSDSARCKIETMVRFHEFQKMLAILSGYDIMQDAHHEYVCFDNDDIKVSRYHEYEKE